MKVIFTKKTSLIFLSIFVAIGIIILAYLFFTQKNIREQNNYPKKNAQTDEFTQLQTNGYYISSSYSMPNNKLIESIVFIDATPIEIRKDNNEIFLTIEIRTNEKTIKHSLSTKHFFLLENLSQNYLITLLNISNYEKVIKSRQYQAVFIYTPSTISIENQEILEMCEAKELTPSLEIICLQNNSNENYSIPYFQFIDNLRIDEPHYFENFLFTGFIEI